MVAVEVQAMLLPMVWQWLWGFTEKLCGFTERLLTRGATGLSL